MNYELKSVQPASLFVNALRILLIVGFITGIYSFFIRESMQIPFWWQKMAATLIFTVVYALVASMFLFVLGRIYNSWILELDLPSLFIYNVITFAIPGVCFGIVKFFSGFATQGILSNLGSALVITLISTAGLPMASTVLTLIWHALFGPSKGITITLDQTPGE